jgi:hypothetical protein
VISTAIAPSGLSFPFKLACPARRRLRCKRLSQLVIPRQDFFNRMLCTDPARPQPRGSSRSPGTQPVHRRRRTCIVLFSMLPIGGAQRTLRDLHFGGGNPRKMRYSSVILRALCLLVVLVPLPSPSNADAAKADLLSRESNELRAQGKYVEAVEKARQAVDEAKNAGLENNSP